MKVNYIRHIESVAVRMSEDDRLNTAHVSMYLALFLIWNHNRFQNPLSINRSEVMKISKIGARATYHKCMTELHEWGYLNYQPSHNPLRGSLVNLFNFDTTTETTGDTTLEQLTVQLPGQVLGPSINSIKQNKQIKQEKQKREKTQFSPPDQEEVISFFLLNGWKRIEAESFYDHYQSNGWLVGGKAKMKDWHAAARNWIKRSANFKTSSKANDRLNTNNDKDYSIPL
ncbi:MAG: transcriptional regulator [Bacteroidetes bacterium]|nr:MAG: transcriptional regulator [Bacteroidota bacterium]